MAGKIAPTVPHPVRRRREALGMTQRELAERAGISRRAVRYIEYGATPLRATRLMLAIALDCEPADLGERDRPG